MIIRRIVVTLGYFNLLRRGGCSYALLLCIACVYAAAYPLNALAAAPVAADDFFSVGTGLTLSSTLSGNDSNLDGPADVYSKLTDPANGIAIVYANGSFEYTPNGGYLGSDSFTYQIDDGDGNVSSALVTLSVIIPSDFIHAANPFLITAEDTPVNLGLSVAPDLFDGGALQDIIETQTAFRAHNAGAVPVLFPLSPGATSISITGYSTQFLDTGDATNDHTDDDYQTLSVRVDLVRGTSSGQLAFLNDGKLNLLDQFSWENVPLGQAVLSDPTKVIGFSTGASNPVIRISGGNLELIETHALESAYLAEFLTSDGDSANFISAGNSVQAASQSSSTLTIPTELEPVTGKHGFIVLNAYGAAAGTNSSVEYKGFSRVIIDLDAKSISGVIVAQQGETSSRTVTYAFDDYTLVDQRLGGAPAPTSVLSSTANVTGDITGIATVREDLTIYLNASGELVIERDPGYAGEFTSMFTAEFYERTGYSSIASFVSVSSADALFDSSPVDGVDEFGDPIDQWQFNVPASAKVGIFHMSWNTIGGNDLNENIGFGFAVVDLVAGTSSGSITFIRTSTPDLLSWDQVPLGTTFFGATSGGGAPLYQSNKVAGGFTDRFVQTSRFSIQSNPDGSRTLTFTATSNGGTQNFKDYRGNAHSSWLGNEPFQISGVPVAGLFSHGSPVVGGNWELDFADLPALSYAPVPEAAGQVDLSFSLPSTGEVEPLQVNVYPVADAGVLSASDRHGYSNTATALTITVGDSTDTDGSESQLQSLTLTNVPGSVTLSASSGSVFNNGGGTWTIDRLAAASLSANSATPLSATTITVTGVNTDQYDVDGDSLIEDGDNGSGVDELDTLTQQISFDLSINSLPTVDSLVTNSLTPTIIGTAVLGAQESLSVLVNGVNYSVGDGNLSIDAGGNWSLQIPAANALVENTYSVVATLTHSGGNTGMDVSDNELVVDTTPPPAPGVTSQTTSDSTPVIEGTTVVATGIALSVTVNSVVYTVGDGHLIDNGDGTWALTIPAVNALADGVYEVLAVHTDAAGNTSQDAANNELVVDTTAPTTPGVTSQTTNDTTPVISGTAVVGSGETLTVEVNSVVYLAGAGHLVYNIDNTWSLSIPAANTLPEASYDVTAVVQDTAGNTSTDPSSSELVIDTTAPASPMVNSQLTHLASPLITGTATVTGGEQLQVQVDGVLYVQGDGHLQVNGDGSWSLTVPAANAMAEGIYDVSATVVDAASNTSSDLTTNELEIDLTPPAVPTVMSLITNSTAPVLVGTATPVGGDVLQVEVDSVVYTAGDGYLVDHMDGSWTLTLPVAAALAEGTYSVTASITDTAGNLSEDPTSQELIVDLTPPPAPGVTSQTTTDTTPLVSGTLPIATGLLLTVEINSVVYTAGDGNLVDNGDGSWDLLVPAIDALADASYQVIARLADAAGNVSTDPSTDELLVDTTAPLTPGVTSLTTNNTTPTIQGTAVVGAGETLTVAVNSVLYTAGDGNLVDNGDGTWNLTIPATNALAEAHYDVTATVTDTAGNLSTDPSSGELLVDTTAPAAPSVNAQLDNSTTPVLTGSATILPGEVLTVEINGVTYTAGDGHLNDNGDGTWTLAIPAGNALPEGTHEIVVTLTDAAGNAISDSTNSELVIDITPPPAPAVNSLITNLVTPVLSGSAVVSGTDILTVSVDGQLHTAGDGQLSDNGDGTWTLIVPLADALVEGSYEVVATVTDQAGNASSDSSSNELIIDLTPPPAPGVTSQTTMHSTPVISGTTVVGTGTVLSVEVNSIVYTAGDGNLVDNGDGTWALTIPAANALPDALYQVIATLTDAAGNSSVDPGVDELLVDTTAPSSPGVTSLTINTTTPVISGTAVLAAGESLTVEVNGIVYTAGDGNLVDNGDGTWDLSIPVANTLPEGQYDVTATVTDSAGNTSSDPSSSELEVDTTAPVSPSVNPLLTNTNLPVISGAAVLAAGETLTVEVNGIVYTAGDGNLVDNGDGSWTLTLPAGNELPEGVQDVTVTVTDLAGNASSDATVAELEVDLTAPPVPTVANVVSNLSSPVVSGTATTTPGDTLTVEVNGIVYTAGDGHLIDHGDGSWSLTLPVADALSEGSYDILVTVTDAAGNSAVDNSTAELRIDQTPPPVPGVSSQVTLDTTPLVSGTAATTGGSVLTVEVNSIVYTAGDGNLVDNGDGTWALTIPAANALPDALYQVIATLTDTAGNSSVDPGVDELLVDTTAPSSPGVTSLTINTTTPVISGTAVLAAGESLTVEVNGIVYTAGDGNLVDNGDGTWDLSIPVANTLPEGQYDVTAIVTDVAGNTSSDPSSAELEIDTTAPVSPTVDPLLSNSDLPVISGTATLGVGETLTVEINGVVYSAGDGNLLDHGDGTWTLTLPAGHELPEGVHDVVVSVTDQAGNLSSDSTSTELEVDLTAPPIPMVNAVISNNNNPVVSGTATISPGDTLTVEVDGIVYSAGDGHLLDNGDGTWDLTIPAANALSEGSYEVIATVVDSAGNASSDASIAELLIDTTAPVSPAVDSLLSNSNLPLITGTASVGAGETLTVEVNGEVYTAGDGNLLDNGDGSWALTLPAGNELPEGVHNVVVNVTDPAGNISSDSTFAELQVDLTAPPLPTVSAVLSNSSTPVISGTATTFPGDTLRVELNGTVYVTGDGHLVEHGDGSWTLTLPGSDALAEGHYDVQVSITDAAGNSATDVTTAELSIDQTPPPAPGVTSQTTMDSTPVISGTTVIATATLLTVEVNTVVYTAGDGNLVDNGDGSWDLTIPTVNLLPDGLYQVIATLIDAAGNSSTDPGADELLVDTTAPPSPGVTSLVINTTSPVITGTAVLAPGETLTVEVNGVIYTVGDGHLVDNADGSWELMIPLANALTEGSYDVTATVTDSAGNASSDPSTAELLIDTTAPVQPSINPLLVNSNTPVITGSATPAAGEILTVEVGGVIYTAGDGSLTLNPDGSWELVISNANVLPEGTLDVVVTLTDSAGNSISDSTNGELIVDITPPTAPGVTSQTTMDSTPTISGTRIIDADVELTVEVNGILYIAGAGLLVDSGNGRWDLNIPATHSLADGLYEIVATLTDAAGNSSSDPSSNELLIDTAAPAAPGVTSQDSNSATPVISGTAVLAAGELLTLEINGIIYTAGDGHLLDNGDGTWELTVPATHSLPEGLYDVVATVTDAAGNSSTDPGGNELLVDTTFPATPMVVVQQSNSTTPSLSGTATLEPGESLSVEVNGVVYTPGDGHLILDSEGGWTLQIPVTDQLGEGSFGVLAVVTDSAGNQSFDPDVNELLIDTTPPASPTVNSQISSSNTPTVSGSATLESGEILSVSINGVSYTDGDGFLTVNPDGSWSVVIPPSHALPNGEINVIATVTDMAGNSSSSSAPHALFIDTVSPELTAAVDEPVLTNRPRLSGTTDLPDGEQITVQDADGNTVCSAIVTAGEWACTAEVDLPIGPQSLSVSGSDAAGNQVVVSVSFELSDDFDGDGIPNAQEGFADSDNDGVIDSVDLDSDNDGIPDSVESTEDTDGDGVLDYQDLDSDNDGLADVLEAVANIPGVNQLGQHMIADYTDANSNGLDDALESTPWILSDSDFDNIPDYLDSDSDNDGIPDTLESIAIDDNRDGLVDEMLDVNRNGLEDTLEYARSVWLDTDEDGVPDYLDLDSDNDGVFDVVEAGTADIDGDGIVDTVADTNQNGIPDSIDSLITGADDADGDGIADYADATFLFDGDADGDGIIDRYDPDQDGNGYADDVLPLSAALASLPDVDNNNVPDFQQSGAGPLRVGLSGRGGCSVSVKQQRAADPTLLLLSILAIVWLSRSALRRRAKVLKQSRVGTLQTTLLALSLCLFSANSSIGDDEIRKRVYLSGSLGISYLDPDDSDSVVKARSHTDSALGLAIGMDINARISAELQGMSLGSVELTDGHSISYQLGNLSGLLYGLSSADNRTQREGLNPYARVGLGVLRNASKTHYVRDNDYHLLFGAGLEYGMRSKNMHGLALRGEITSYETDAHYLGVSLLYRFGAESTALEADSYKPVTTPEPVAVVAQPVVATPRAPLADDSEIAPVSVMFKFNSDDYLDLRQTQIDALARYIVFRPDDQFEIAAYTDPIGPAEFNQALSQRRAIRVARLLESLGVANQQLILRVVGETTQFGSSAERYAENRRVVIQKLKD